MKKLPTHEELDQLAIAAGDKIGKDIEKITKKAKKLLKPLGLDIKIMYVAHEIGTDPLKDLSQADIAE